MMMMVLRMRTALGVARVCALVFALPLGALAGCDVQDAVENPGTIRTEDAGDDATQDAGDVGSDAGDVGQDGDDVSPDAEDVSPDADSDASPDAGDAEVDVPLEPLPPRPWSVLEQGYYEVGHRTLDVRYTPRGMTEARSSKVVVWYPTRDTRGTAARYLFNGYVREGVWTGARVALEEPAPLMVFSHGHQGFPEQSFFFAEYFASHGWVVAAPTHTGNTLLDLRPRAPMQFEWRAQDLSATIDALVGLPEGDPLAGLVRGEQVVVAGHSYGGYTTLSIGGAGYDTASIEANCSILDDPACGYVQEALPRYEEGFFDPRVALIVPMAPGNNDAFGAAGLAEVGLPTLLLTGLLDGSLSDANHGTPIWEGLDGASDVRAQFLTGGHYTFTDACALLPSLGNGCGEGYVSTEEAHPVINALSMAFIRLHLEGDATDADLLTGARSLSSDVEISTKTPP
jgi:predicted dienelactone hydrolase